MSTLLPEFIKFIDIGSKTLLMYSEKHPRTQQVIDRVFAMLNEAIGERESITVSLAEGNLLLEGELVERGNPVLERFAKDLFARNIHSLTFLQGIQQEELVALLRDLNLKPQKIREMGGFEKILLDNGTKNIQINRIKYGIITGDDMPGVDQGLLSELLLAVQTMLSGAADADSSAESLEKSLDSNPTADPGGLLFRIFQLIAQKTPSPSDEQTEAPLKQRFVDLFRSFTPAMQGKLLLSAILKSTTMEKSPLKDFYRDLTPGELEESLLSLLDQSISEQELRDVFVSLLNDKEIQLTENVRTTWEDLGIIEKQIRPWDNVLKKDVLSIEDIETIPDFLKSLIAEGNVTDADKLSRRVFACLSLGKPEQKLASIRTLPSVIHILSQHERWKSVDFSASLLVSTCFRKENDTIVLHSFFSFLLDSFRKNFEKLQFASCHDLLAAVRARAEHDEAMAAQLVQHLPVLSGPFREEMGRGFEGAETGLQYLKMCGEPGIDFLLDWLAEEEDRHVRSRIIAFLEKFTANEIMKRIEQRLTDPRWYVIRNMVTIIGKLNLNENPPFLKGAAAHQDGRVAKEVIKILYKNCDKVDLPLVISLMQHDDKTVRVQATHIVMIHHFTEAIPELLKQIDVTVQIDSDVRAVAYQALLRLRAKGALPFAQLLLEKKTTGKSELAERNAAVRLVGELGVEESKDLLKKIAQTDQYAETRALAAGYLNVK
ncbi:MAG TPA: hypothetical protein VJ521_07035 [Acidobacteriota bacterium]|nr:hypothetical protein [Acidobacteriota bacterium]